MKTSAYAPTHAVEPGRRSTDWHQSLRWWNPLLVLLTLLSLSAASVRAQTLTNWLANPGFEQGTTSWVNMPPWLWNGASFGVENTNTFVYGSTTTKVSVHGGTNAFKIWGYFQSYATTVGAMQTFPCAPGSTWTASGNANTQAPNQMTSTETSYIEVQFLDANTNVVSGGDFSSATMTTASPVSTWVPFQVTDGGGGTSLTAPPGTAFVRFLIRFYQPAGYPGGSCYWDDVSLIRTSKPDPEFTVQPAAQTVNYGQTATFSVVADGQTALSYNWQKDGANITDPNAHGVHTATLTLSNATTAMQGSYTCTITDQAGSLTSDGAQLTVNDPGVVSITPALGQTVTNGTTAKISVFAVGSSPLSYYWTTQNGLLSDNGHYSGTTTSNLTIANVTAADAGTYTVNVDYGLVQATSGLKVVQAAQVATNLLINPGFEDGVLSEPWEAAWGRFNGAGLATTNDYYYLSGTPVSVYAGQYVCRTYASDPDNGLNETVPAVAGATYHAGGHFYVSSVDPVTGAAWTVMQVMFKNAGGGTITTFNTMHVDTNYTTDAWTFLHVTNNTDGGVDLVAPAGTVAATVQIYEYAQLGGGGSVYFDDLYLTQTVPPAPPAFSLSVTKTGGQINISFPTANGVTYDVLNSSNPASPLASWQTTATVMGDGSVKSVPDTLGAGARFYRVRAHY